MNRIALTAASAFAIAVTAVAAPAAHAQPGTAPTAQHSEGQKLRDLLARSEAAALDRSPISAFYRGDFSDADKLGDFSPASFAADRVAVSYTHLTLPTIYSV